MTDTNETKEEKSELPDVKDVKKVSTPTDPHMKQAFENAAINAVQAVVIAEQALELTKAKFDDSSTSDDIPAAEEELAKAKLRLEIVAKAQGITVKEMQGKTVGALTNTIMQAEERLVEWKRLCQTHQAFLDTPEAFGYVDFGGSPIVPEEQRVHIVSYEAAIAAGETHVKKLKAQRDALLSSPEK